MKKLISKILVIAAIASIALPTLAKTNQVNDAAKEIREEKSIEKGQELKKQNSKNQKTKLNNLIDKLIKQVENFKNRILKNKEIYEGLENSLIAETDAIVAKLNDFKARIASVTNGELKILVQELRFYQKEVIQLKTRRLVFLSQIGQFESSIIKKTESRSARITEAIVKLKNAGKDISKLEPLLNGAKSKIADVKAKLNQLRGEVNTGDLGETKTAEIRNALNEIKDQIKEVYQIFRAIAQEGARQKI